MNISTKLFGILQDGREVCEYTLDADGFIVSFLDLGGYIRHIGSETLNLVLNYPTIDGYENDSAYLSCIVGRTSGRTAKGILKVDNKFYQLNVNNGVNHLHGGINGFNKKIARVEKISGGDFVGCRLYFESQDKEENYPGNVNLCVTYLVTWKKELKITYEAVCDQKCPLNFTQHVYFNLNGNPNLDIANHTLKIDADKYGFIDETGVPSKLEYCQDVLDLRNGRKLEDIFNSNYQQVVTVNHGIDHPFLLNKNSRSPIKVTTAKASLRVETSYDSVVCYTGNYLNNEQVFNDGVKGRPHNGFCLECQYMPNSNAVPEFGNMIFEANERYHHTTIFRFDY